MQWMGDICFADGTLVAKPSGQNTHTYIYVRHEPIFCVGSAIRRPLLNGKCVDMAGP